jgi:hypothetical protein
VNVNRRVHASAGSDIVRTTHPVVRSRADLRPVSVGGGGRPGTAMFWIVFSTPWRRKLEEAPRTVDAQVSPDELRRRAADVEEDLRARVVRRPRWSGRGPSIVASQRTERTVSRSTSSGPSPRSETADRRGLVWPGERDQLRGTSDVGGPFALERSRSNPRRAMSSWRHVSWSSSSRLSRCSIRSTRW